MHIGRWYSRSDRDGWVSIVSMNYASGRQQLKYCSLHLVPGAAAPLRRVCVGGHNMLLIYADDRVRLWDIQTTEFWRSTSVDKAEELLSQGGWTEL
jgi:hypothetical protein